MKRIVPRIVVAMGIAGVFAGSSSPAHAADPVPRAGAGGGEKLLVFILAGQSNMQGQAAASTLAYLQKPPYVPTKAIIISAAPVSISASATNSPPTC